MEKFIILAGSPNSGKTITVNYAIKKLIDLGFKEDGMIEDRSEPKFWTITDQQGEPTTGGNIKLSKNSYKVLLISYGDKEKTLGGLFNKFNFNEFDAVVCCSHATRGKNIFKLFVEKIKGIDLNTTKIIPLHKNFLYDKARIDEVNNFTADLIVELLQKI